MKRIVACLVVLFVLGTSGSSVAAPQAAASTSAPTLVRLDGQLKTEAGDARTGSVTLVVSLYAEKDDTTPLWMEQQPVTLDGAGRYTIYAGATLPDGVPQAFLSGSTAGRWVGVGVQGEPEQFRMMLVTVPYAAKAREADTLAGKSATDFVLSENLGDTVKAALKADLSKASSASGDGPGVFGTTNAIQKGAGGAAIQDATGFVEVGGNIGVGTGTPQHTLHVLQTSPTGNAVNVNRNLPAASTDSPVMYIRQQNAGDDQPTILIDSFGSGAAIGVLNGNVGVGTASPLAALDINRSSTGSTAISVANPTPGTGNYSRLDIKTNAGGGRGLFDAYSSTFTSSGNSVAGGVSFTGIGPGGFSIAHQDASAPIRFYTGAGPSEQMRLTSGGFVGIGTTTPTQKLDVSGDINMTGGLRQGGTTILTTSSNIMAVGPFAALLSATGSNTTAVGRGALSALTSGNGNTAVGAFALNVNTSGPINTAVGVSALGANTTGGSNTAIGRGALQANTTANANTATGQNALAANTTANNNTATGQGALQANTAGDDNTATGQGALQANTTGFGNTAMGNLALGANTTGSVNTAVGHFALQNSTGSANTALGGIAGNSATTGNYNIFIGRGVVGTAADTNLIRIGLPYEGTATPPNGQNQTFIAGIRGIATGLADAVSVVIDSNGQLGTISSSRRFKEDIQSMGEASRGLLGLRPVTFRYQKPFADGSKPLQYGLIAEEVAEVYPDLVARSADGQIETVKYQVLDAMLLNELQRQQTELHALVELNRALEQQNHEFRERLAAVETALARGDVPKSRGN